MITINSPIASSSLPGCCIRGVFFSFPIKQYTSRNLRYGGNILFLDKEDLDKEEGLKAIAEHDGLSLVLSGGSNAKKIYPNKEKE